jgi:HSP20 family molecular chaperone IbpA
MAATQDVARTEGAAPQRAQREEQYVIQPAVDIFEDAHGIMVVAEMPGVSRERLNVQADRNSLTIQGEAAIDIPKDMEAIHAEVHSTRYSRSFVLSGELETDAIDAKLKDGVLTIRIPKRREYRPRKVEVRTD